jgi:ferredoxin-thioredoxin reductase catalytic subunit
MDTFNLSWFWRRCNRIREKTLVRRKPPWYNREKPIRQRKENSSMAIRLNEDAEIVATVRQGLKEKGGYCPCRLGTRPEYKCMCQEFRDQIADPEFEGYCHCMLYYKSKD